MKPPRARLYEGAADVPGLASRRIAAEAVAAALAQTATLDDALVRAAPEGDPLARAIAITTFRRFGTLQAALAARLDKGLPTDPAFFAVLATGAAQILFMDVADHASVDLAVRLAAEGRRSRHLTGLVNAVLRRTARERDAILAGASGIADLPDWLRQRWTKAYGAERAEAMAQAHLLGAALDLTCPTDAAGWAGRIGGTLLPSGSIRILDRRPAETLPGFTEGAWWVQDAAAALPARILDVRRGERVLDMCAAPGGKTAQLAAAGADVTAVDRSGTRLKRAGENLARLKLGAEFRSMDALAYKAPPFDAILLDAPCTATGTIRRHPDIAWTKGDADVAALADLQRRLLDHAAGLLRPGGRLVYCVCSLEPEEGEEQAAAFLERHPEFRRVPIDPERLGVGADLVTAVGDLRTAPDQWQSGASVTDEAGAVLPWRPGLDGFYAVSMSKDAA